jgi:hypothetical protein
MTDSACRLSGIRLTSKLSKPKVALWLLQNQGSYLRREDLDLAANLRVQ